MNRELYGLGDYNTAQLKQMALEVEREGLDPTPIYRRRPDTAAEPKAIVKEMPLSDAPFIIPDAFANPMGPEIASALSLPQMEKIGAEGEEYLKGAIKIALGAAVKKNPNDEHVNELMRYVSLSPAWAV